MADFQSDYSKVPVEVRDFIAMFMPSIDNATPYYQKVAGDWIVRNLDILRDIIVRRWSVQKDGRFYIVSGKAVEMLNVYFYGLMSRKIQERPDLFFRTSLEEARKWIGVLKSAFDSPEKYVAYGPRFISYVWDRVSSGLVWDVLDRRARDVYFDDSIEEWFVRANASPHLFAGTGDPPLGVSKEDYQKLSRLPVIFVKMWAVPRDVYAKPPSTRKKLKQDLLSEMQKLKNPSFIESCIKKEYTAQVEIFVNSIKGFPPEEWPFLAKVFFEGKSLIGVRKFFADRADFQGEYRPIPSELSRKWIEMLQSETGVEKIVELTGENIAIGNSYVNTAFIENFDELRLEKIYQSPDPRSWFAAALETRDEFSKITPLNLSVDEINHITEAGSILSKFSRPELKRN